MNLFNLNKFVNCCVSLLGTGHFFSDFLNFHFNRSFLDRSVQIKKNAKSFLGKRQTSREVFFGQRRSCQVGVQEGEESVERTAELPVH